MNLEIGQTVDVYDETGALIGYGEIMEQSRGEYVVRLSEERSMFAPADRVVAW